MAFSCSPSTDIKGTLERVELTHGWEKNDIKSELHEKEMVASKEPEEH